MPGGCTLSRPDPWRLLRRARAGGAPLRRARWRARAVPRSGAALDESGGCPVAAELSATSLAACLAGGVPVIHFHDLRHTGNTLAAHAGASLRELMDRMGYSTTRAAMVYLHATDERQWAITDALSQLAVGNRPRPSSAPSARSGHGSAGCLVRIGYRRAGPTAGLPI